MSPFAPTDLDREVRRGIDAVRMSIGLGATSQVEPACGCHSRRALRTAPSCARAWNLAGWDFSLTVAKYVQDLVIGGDFSGDLGKLGAHGEAAWTLPLVGLDGSGPMGVEGDFARAVVGLDWKPAEGLVLTAEYMFNGFGAARPEDLLGRCSRATGWCGVSFPGPRATPPASSPATRRPSCSASERRPWSENVGDGSAMFVPSAEYWFEQRVLVRAGGYVPIGRGLDTSVFHGLTGADVVGNSPKWAAAVRPRSACRASTVWQATACSCRSACT